MLGPPFWTGARSDPNLVAGELFHASHLLYSRSPPAHLVSLLLVVGTPGRLPFVHSEALLD